MIDKNSACVEHRSSNAVVRSKDDEQADQSIVSSDTAPAADATPGEPPVTCEKPATPVAQPKKEGDPPVRKPVQRPRPPIKETWYQRMWRQHPVLSLVAIILVGGLLISTGATIVCAQYPDLDFCPEITSRQEFPPDRIIPRGPVVNPGVTRPPSYCDSHDPFVVYGPSPYDRDNDGIACED